MKITVKSGDNPRRLAIDILGFCDGLTRVERKIMLWCAENASEGLVRLDKAAKDSIGDFTGASEITVEVYIYGLCNRLFLFRESRGLYRLSERYILSDEENITV